MENYTGRNVLTIAPPGELTAKTVGSILDKVMALHTQNSLQTDKLYRFYKGDQPILGRMKDIRPEINNTIVENRAFEVVEFKKGYEFSHPVQYTNAGENETAPIHILNSYARLDGKDAKDLALAEWMYIAGAGYRLCLPNKGADIDDAPYFTAVLDPRKTFVIYADDVKRTKLMAGMVTQRQDENGRIVAQYAVYTQNRYFLWERKGVSTGGFAKEPPIVDETQILGIPIVEYALNPSRIGYVELCYHLFNALNTLVSNRMDAIEQFVQALLVFINCELPKDPKTGEYVIPRTGDVVHVPAAAGQPASVQYLVAQLNQADTQVGKEDLLDAIHDIVGMPDRQSRSGGGGDTGQAVVLRNGWGAAEARAKSTEKQFKIAEYELLKLVLKICRNTSSSAKEIAGLTLQDIGMSFTRNRSDNMQTKAQTLKTLLDAGVNPEDAFEHSDMFSDPTAAYLKSLPYLRQTEPNNKTISEKDTPKEVNNGFD